MVWIWRESTGSSWQMHSEVSLPRLTKSLEFYIVNTPARPVFGFQACRLMNLIKMNVNAEVKIQPSNMTNEPVMEKYADVFRGVGELKGECSIKLKAEATPVVHAP